MDAIAGTATFDDQAAAALAVEYPGTDFVVLTAADFEQIRLAVRGAGLDAALDGVTLMPLTLEVPAS